MVKYIAKRYTKHALFIIVVMNWYYDAIDIEHHFSHVHYIFKRLSHYMPRRFFLKQSIVDVLQVKFSMQYYCLINKALSEE